MEKEIIKLDQYLSSDNKYPERLQSVELTKEVKDNAVKLLNKINQLLTELKITKVVVSSGFRTSVVNSKTPGAAKKSAHMSGKACDIVDDKDQTLGKLIAEKRELLKKYGLMIEDLGSTKGKNSNWVHLDDVDRADRPSRSFKP